MKMLQRIIISLSVFAIFTFFTHSHAQNYQWDAVAMGGGGFVNAVIPSKTEQGLFYARTDVGGAYRWDKNQSRWIALTDWVSQDQVGYLGVESLALDPKDSAKVYMLVGISYFNNGRSAILKSDDYGNTFKVVDISNQFKAHGNGMGRQTGEKLVVDPINSNVLYTGTRWNGLFKSTNGGDSWTRLSSLNVTTTPNENGISFVALDPSSEQAGAAKNIFVGVSRFPSVGANFYRSSDAGQTFTAISGGPADLMPMRAIFDARGDLLITYANGAGPHGHNSQPEPMDKGQVWKYSPATNSWSNITPANFSRAFSGISVDPNDADHIIVSSCNTYMYQYDFNGQSAWGDQIFSTRDGGKNWTNLIAKGLSLDTQGIDWISGHSIHWAGSLEFDPFDTKNIYVTSGNGIFKTQDTDASPIVWSFWVKGIEETVPLGLVSIPNGPAVSVIGDYDGFVHTDVTQFAPGHKPRMGTSTSITVASNDPRLMVRVGNSLYYSTDTAATWSQLNFSNGVRGHAALNADGTTLVYSPDSTTDNKDIVTSYYTKNWGQTWNVVQGLSMSDARVIADTVNSQKMYALNGNKMLVSLDAGASFQQMGSLPSSNGSKVIRAVPGIEGGLWVALGNNGLAKSSDSGANFTLVNGVTAAQAVGFGKAAAGANFPTIFIWGTINNVTGIFRSTDSGSSWERINDSAHQFGGPGNGNFILGDMNTFGTVYMSTAGRGIIYGKLSADGSSDNSSISSSTSNTSSSSSSLVTSSSSAMDSSASSSSAVVSSSISSANTSSAPATNSGSGGGSLGGYFLLLLVGLALLNGCGDKGGASSTGASSSSSNAAVMSSVSTSAANISSASASSQPLAANCDFPREFSWDSSGPLIVPQSADHASIKDPTIVFYNNKYHVFATVWDSNRKGWGSVYLNFNDFSSAGSATQISMENKPTGSAVAPQVFFFRPHNKWYLIYQWGAKYSTNTDISNPDTWTRPQPLLANGLNIGLDYWVICDDANCHLFFSGDDGNLYRSKTPIDNFPNFSGYEIVMSDEVGKLFEASNVYKVEGKDLYLLLVEAYGPRYFRSWTATSLDGPWTPLADSQSSPFAGEANVSFAGEKWTRDISHGEMIRSGYDETLTINPCNMQFLYQGVDPASTATYTDLPYRLGLIKQTSDR
ncbi:non-reducing end alpha-L-arabinofuranosidase family hydrolase [Cellvibrio fontiphilus]|uniref:Alpha-L-arabinofuranosidase n=1 Tax=Cellvibrio fontiphilus TaxID=1815559 RepID=A0ABV7FD47_9GAMM